MAAMKGWGYLDTLCYVGSLLQTRISCRSSLW